MHVTLCPTFKIIGSNSYPKSDLASRDCGEMQHTENLLHLINHLAMKLQQVLIINFYTIVISH